MKQLRIMQFGGLLLLASSCGGSRSVSALDSSADWPFQEKSVNAPVQGGDAADSSAAEAQPSLDAAGQDVWADMGSGDAAVRDSGLESLGPLTKVTVGNGLVVNPSCSGLWNGGFVPGSGACFTLSLDVGLVDGAEACLPPNPLATASDLNMRAWQNEVFGCANSDAGPCPAETPARHGMLCCGDLPSLPGGCSLVGAATTFEQGTLTDVDLDLVWDIEDNCPYVENADPFGYLPFQQDTDGDGIGDVCDNCPAVYNPSQRPTDCDDAGNIFIATLGAGVSADPTCSGMPTDTFLPGKQGLCTKLDLTADAAAPTSVCFPTAVGQLGVAICSGPGEPCPRFSPSAGSPARHGQYCCDYLPGDPSYGELCFNVGASRFATGQFAQFRDTDGDAIADVGDNCPFLSNVDQRDSDSDGVGDVCDDCPYTYDPGQAASVDGGVGTACNCALPGVLLGANGCPCSDGAESRVDGADVCGLVGRADGGVSDGL
jgi:hypothetical protein